MKSFSYVVIGIDLPDASISEPSRTFDPQAPLRPETNQPTSETRQPLWRSRRRLTAYLECESYEDFRVWPETPRPLFLLSIIDSQLLPNGLRAAGRRKELAPQYIPLTLPLSRLLMSASSDIYAFDLVSGYANRQQQSSIYTALRFTIT